MPASRLYQLVLVLSGCLILTTTAAKADSYRSATKNVDQLELKYFHHDYKKQPLDTRVSRLEKLVFGTANGGDLNDRVDRLVSASEAPPPELATGLPLTYKTGRKPVRSAQATPQPKPKQPPRVALFHQAVPPSKSPTRTPQVAPNYQKQLARKNSSALSYNRSNRGTPAKQPDNRPSYNPPTVQQPVQQPDTTYDTANAPSGLRDKATGFAGKLRNLGKKVWDYF